MQATSILAGGRRYRNGTEITIVLQWKYVTVVRQYNFSKSLLARSSSSWLLGATFQVYLGDSSLRI